MLGQRIGSWILEDELGRGGMGEVYRARHATLQTSAAVKVLTTGLESEEDFRTRFEREAGTQARLRHPNIAQVLDYLEHEGRWFLVIEYLGHGSLADRLRDGCDPVSIEQAIAWTRQTLCGLGHAHKNGVVHRDVKPANLLLNEHGHAVVTDFGIAKSDAHTKMTSTGVSVGTPQYMSPEQVTAPKDVDPRSDVYSVGIVLYELLAGRTPFDGDSAFTVLQAHVQQEPPPIRDINPRVSAALERVVLKALAKNREDRFDHCRDMEQALEAVERGEEPVPAFATSSTADSMPAGATVLEPVSVAPASSPVRSATVLASSPGLPVPRESPGPLVDLGLRRVRKRRAMIAALVGVLLAAGIGAFLLFGGDDEVPVVETPGVEFPSFQGGLPADPPEGLMDKVTDRKERAAEAARRAEAAAKDAERAAQEAEGASNRAGRTEDPKEAADATKASATAATASRKAAGESGEQASVAGRAAKEAQQMGMSVGAIPQNAWHPLDVLWTMAFSTSESPPSETRPEWAIRLEEIAAEAQRSADAAKASAERAEASAKRAAASVEKAHRGVENLRSKLLDQATSRPPLPSGPLPDQPVTAVLVQGDPVLAAPLEARLEERLRRAGIDVRDEHNSLEVSETIRNRGSEVSPKELGPLLVREGFHVLVLVRIEEGERRSLSIRRQAGHMTFARIRVNSHLLLTGRPLGRGWTEMVEYTELSAEAKAKQALVKDNANLIQAIRDGWGGYQARVAQAGGNDS